MFKDISWCAYVALKNIIWFLIYTLSQPNEPLASLVASPMSLWLLWWPPTGSSMSMVVVLLFMYSVLHCLYSVGNKNTTTIYRKLFASAWCNASFYHDVEEIFWPQPIRSLKLGHVTGRGCISPTWVGRVSDLGKNGFHKKCKNLDDIAVYIWLHIKNKSEKINK